MNTQKKTIFVAHRGLQPENTLWAFKHAYAQGFEAAECDVWLTQDHHVVVCHDETLKRTAVSKGNLANQPISSLSYEQLRTVFVGDAEHSEPVPLLTELLEIVPISKLLLVEIKFKETDKISHVINCVKSHLDKVIVISFYPNILVALKELLPDCRTILLTTAKQYHEKTVIVKDPSSLHQALVFLAENNLDGLGFEYGSFIAKNNLSQLPSYLLTELWYGEKDPEKVKSIVDIAIEAGIGFVNVDGMIAEEYKFFRGSANVD